MKLLKKVGDPEARGERSPVSPDSQRGSAATPYHASGAGRSPAAETQPGTRSIAHVPPRSPATVAEANTAQTKRRSDDPGESPFQERADVFDLVKGGGGARGQRHADGEVIAAIVERQGLPVEVQVLIPVHERQAFKQRGITHEEMSERTFGARRKTLRCVKAKMRISAAAHGGSPERDGLLPWEPSLVLVEAIRVPPVAPAVGLGIESRPGVTSGLRCGISCEISRTALLDLERMAMLHRKGRGRGVQYMLRT
jgi:hypothetical protein